MTDLNTARVCATETFGRIDVQRYESPFVLSPSKHSEPAARLRTEMSIGLKRITPLLHHSTNSISQTRYLRQGSLCVHFGHAFAIPIVQVRIIQRMRGLGG